MSNSSLVRASRDGDQFHYLWAARRCLKLLSAASGLVAVAIEGPSPDERPGNSPIDEGEELIDIAEYFGAEDLSKAYMVRYMQLKHSTLHEDTPWSASGMEKTLRGFAKRLRALQKVHSPIELEKKLEFWFVTNRPVSQTLVEAVTDAANNAVPRHARELEKLEEATGLKEANLTTFCKLLKLDCRQDGYWDQRNILFQEVVGYLADADVDAPTQLKELVTRRALSESEHNPTITKTDVLRALKTNETHLFPAPCLVESVENVLPRDQEAELVNRIIEATAPVVVHASGGVGKTVFATRIGRHLPENSACILYDCFGNGQYRNAAQYRHRHKDALVQIANEMAGRGLCHPLIPTTNADTSAYIRAFVYRMEQAATILRLNDPASLLCIVVDASDNAQMAAEEIGEARSFVRDLIRVAIPDGVRLVFVCRSHRQRLLDPPVDTVLIELRPFSRSETAALLRRYFSTASEHDVDEFHRLSSQNPRVQALALSRGLHLDEMLRLLGPNPTSVEDTLASLLKNAIGNLKDSSGPVERQRVDKICTALAALRPLIPIPVLSAISGIEQDAIKSFAYDIGRPLLVVGETIQFLDEPAETWFREEFKPSTQGRASFIATLKPLANGSSYIASMLPQLMLEAGQFSELVELALSSEALPTGSPLEKRDVELQRLQFALKAGLRSKRHLEAAKLALKAGGETAGDGRQRKLLQDNIDLASDFLEPDLIQEIVSRRTFGSGWLGSHHAYEAALLSGRAELLGDARSRLRMAHEWLANWVRMTPEDRKKEAITDQDIAQLTLAQLNINGPMDAATSLGRWTPREVSYRVGRIVTRWLSDHGRWSEIDGIALSATDNLCLEIAVIHELRAVHRTPPQEVVERAFRHLLKNAVKIKKHLGRRESHELLDAVTAVVEAAIRRKTCTKTEAADVLTRYLPAEPPRGLASRFSGARFPLLRAYCLRAALEGEPIELMDVAPAELRDEVGRRETHAGSRELREFRENIGALLPWHKLWASALLGHVPKVDADGEIDKACKATANAEWMRYQEASPTADEIALTWMEIIHLLAIAGETALVSFNRWKGSLKRPLPTSVLNALCRLCAQTDQTKLAALEYATEAYRLCKEERVDAELKSEGFIEAARAVLTVSKPDAKAYFNAAVEVASKIGDENLDRWDAILDLADRTSRMDRWLPNTAYQFARCAELTYEYVVRDKHFAWNSTVIALCGLCPSSAMTILSRWRDRGFGRHERLLPIAVGSLIARNALDPRDALPLIAFRARWNYGELIESVLAKSTEFDERLLASRILYRYAQFSSLPVSELTRIQNVTVGSGITLEGLTDQIALAEKAEASVQEDTAPFPSPLSAAEESEGPLWDEIFSGFDLGTAEGLSEAYLKFEKVRTPGRKQNFFSQAMRRVPIGLEPDFIESAIRMPILNLYSIGTFLQHVPETWKGRPAISLALASALTALVRRHCMELRRSRYYDFFPFDLVNTLAGLSETDIAEVVLAAVGEAPDLMSASRLFTLVGLLAVKLSPDEAMQALNFGLALFDPILEDKDGDGPWSEVFLPPRAARDAVAGYVWAALAAPEASLRWEAAHVVLETCRLERHDVIHGLTKLMAGRTGGAFVDARLPFYSLHASQWLLIALARAVSEAPGIVAVFSDELRAWTHKDQCHVLIRHFAASALLELIAKGYVPDKEGLSERLSGINKSPFPAVGSRAYDRLSSNASRKEVEPEVDRYFFGIDIGPYWYEPLGRVFAVSQDEVEAKALKVIRGDFAYHATRRRDEDERARRNLYADRHTYYSHASYPRADDLHFYHAYHAMMIVAGKLLASTPVHTDPDYEKDDEFADWLSRHTLTRQDGRWLWDRRDTNPNSGCSWLDRDKDHPDRRVTTDGDFKEGLLTMNGMNVWGHWVEADRSREQSTQVRSALVSSDTAGALLRSLATSDDKHAYRIPAAGSEDEVDRPGFWLKGWIIDRGGIRQVEEGDPWAGGISYPPPRPAQYIVDAMKIEADTDLRRWKSPGGEFILESHVWGEYDDARPHDSANPERGSRLQADSSILVSMLKKLDCDLVIGVQIERHRRYQPYESAVNDEDERSQSATKFYLFDRSGALLSL